MRVDLTLTDFGIQPERTCLFSYHLLSRSELDRTETGAVPALVLPLLNSAGLADGHRTERRQGLVKQ